jgi:hypothetical protein
MSNYPNMSYCAFENTSQAIRQLMQMIGEAIDEGEPLRMSSRNEKFAFHEMPALLEEFQDILDQYDEHFAEVEEDEER